MRFRHSTALLIPLLLAGAFGAAFGLGARASGKRQPVRATSSRKAPAAVPFRKGEKLFYQIGWMNLTEAATAELKVEPRRDFYGEAAWHIQAVAHTENPLRYLMVVDDQFDSYCDASTLVTRQYEMYLNEQGKRSVRKLALNEHTPGAETVAAPSGTRDPLAMLYELRRIDWKRTPRVVSPVYDGTHFYRMVAQLAAAHDSVVVPPGKFDASRIRISVSSRDTGAVSMQFTLWLANDRAHTPLEVDADVPVGKIKGQLVRIE